MHKQQYYVVATAIIERDGRYLITRRANNVEKFPGTWTVPGGTLETGDITGAAPNNHGVRYEILQRLVQREVLEETGLRVKNIRYLTSLAYQKTGGYALCISFLASYDGGTVHVQDEELTDHAWVSSDEALNYALIDGIQEELYMADDAIKNVALRPWDWYVDKVAKKRRK